MCGSGFRDGTAYYCVSLINTISLSSFCQRLAKFWELLLQVFSEQNHNFFYCLTFSPHANRFIGLKKVFVDLQGESSSSFVRSLCLCDFTLQATADTHGTHGQINAFFWNFTWGLKTFFQWKAHLERFSFPSTNTFFRNAHNSLPCARLGTHYSATPTTPTPPPR